MPAESGEVGADSNAVLRFINFKGQYFFGVRFVAVNNVGLVQHAFEYYLGFFGVHGFKSMKILGSAERRSGYSLQSFGGQKDFRYYP